MWLIVYHRCSINVSSLLLISFILWRHYIDIHTLAALGTVKRDKDSKNLLSAIHLDWCVGGRQGRLRCYYLQEIRWAHTKWHLFGPRVAHLQISWQRTNSMRCKFPLSTCTFLKNKQDKKKKTRYNNSEDYQNLPLQPNLMISRIYLNVQWTLLYTDVNVLFQLSK